MSTDMNLVANRKETFEKLLDKSSYVRIDLSAMRRLPKHGFYLVGPIQVACIHCNVVFTVQQVLKHTVQMHKLFSPDCKNIEIIEMNELCSQYDIEDENETENEIETKEQKHETEKYEVKSGTDKGTTKTKKSNSEVNKDRDKSEKVKNGKILDHDITPHHPKYKTKKARLKTFRNWPKYIRQRPDDLSDAGFFYTGKSDVVTCYSCGYGIRSWEVDDDPWGEHIRWYSYCDHIQLNKTQEEINDFLRERRIYHPSNNEQTEEDQQSSYTPGMDVTGNLSFENKLELLKHGQFTLEKGLEKMCRIKVYRHECMKCRLNESDSVILPCSHVVACFDCSKAAENCFRCNEKIEKVKRIYFA